jgi:hypothetical protein
MKLLRARGYLVGVVEQTIPKTFIKRDLFGFIDILAVHPVTGETLAVQTTSGSNVSARMQKIRQHENLAAVCAANWSLAIHGWRKNSKNRWVCREIDMGEVSDS